MVPCRQPPPSRLHQHILLPLRHRNADHTPRHRWLRYHLCHRHHPPHIPLSRHSRPLPAHPANLLRQHSAHGPARNRSLRYHAFEPERMRQSPHSPTHRSPPEPTSSYPRHRHRSRNLRNPPRLGNRPLHMDHTVRLCNHHTVHMHCDPHSHHYLPPHRHRQSHYARLLSRRR